LVLCGTLSWLLALVSFWAHANVVHRSVSYHIVLLLLRLHPFNILFPGEPG